VRTDNRSKLTPDAVAFALSPGAPRLFCHCQPATRVATLPGDPLVSLRGMGPAPHPRETIPTVLNRGGP